MQPNTSSKFEIQNMKFWMECKQDGRLPATYFAPPISVKNGFQKYDVFFEKKHSFFIIFSIFSQVQRFRTFW